jgi:hypothetical protein
LHTKALFRKPEGKKALRICRRRCKDNFKVGVKKVEYLDADAILAQNGDQ